MVISLLLGPALKNLLSYDYGVYSKMKLHLVTTAFLPFFLPQALFRNREIATGLLFITLVVTHWVPSDERTSFPQKRI